MTTKKTLKKTGDRTLIIYAHPYDGSFNHAVLETATSALDKAGRSYDVVDSTPTASTRACPLRSWPCSRRAARWTRS